MDQVLQDLRYAIRKLASAPAFSVTAVLTLAIGIGATTAIFSTVNATLLRPLPFAHPEELIALRTRYADGRVTTGLVAPAELARLTGAPSIVRSVGMSSAPFDVTLLRENAQPVHTTIFGVGEGFFDLFGLPMTLGSGFGHDQHVPTGQRQGPGPPPLAVLSHRVWTELFGSDPQIVGKVVRFAELTATVTGVAARDLDVPRGADFWTNLRPDPQDVGHALVASVVGDLRSILLIVFTATTLLLLLACVNVTNLLLGRGAARAREVAVRSALGANRGRIIRQLLTESFVVTVLGAIGGLWLAYAGVRALQTLGASKLPRLESVPFDAHVLGFAALVLVLSGLMLGVAPAIRLARTDIKTLINESGRTTSTGRGTSRLMGAMTVVEIALALMLVAGAAWLVQSFSKLRETDPGFVPSGRLIVDVRPNPASVRGPDQTIAWTHALFDRLRAIPGVTGVGSTAAFPLRGTLDGSLLIQFQGEAFDPARPPGARLRLVTPGFFETMGIPLAAGRDFSPDDRQNTAAVAIVNREFVRRYLAGRDPLHTQFAFGYPTVDQTTLRTIVGVVGDVRYRSIAEAAEPSFYVPQGQFPFPRQAVVVATRLAEPSTLAPVVRAEIARLEPQLAVDVETASHLVSSTLTRQELGMTLMLLFGATALVLAAVGIYGVIAYASAERLGEIATRLALGATPSQVFWLMMRRGHWLATAGAAIGLAAAYAVGRAVGSTVYGLQASDPIVLASATAVVAVITWIATAIPARRAARIDPILALRAD